MLAVGTFPFNSFLAAFFTAGGFFVLTAALRMQLDPIHAEHFRTKGGGGGESGGSRKVGKPMSPERAVADYVLAGALLLFVAWNYIG
jgi:oligosaccharyltransferase complex subunit epsilon